MPFAKAYVRYQQGHKPTKLKNEFKAIRCIEKALLTTKGNADITLVDHLVMDVAGEIAREYGVTSYQAAISLMALVEFLNESGIIPSKLEWRHSIKKPKEINRTDRETQWRRAEKIPEDYLLEAMAEMFANDLPNAKDRFTTSIFGLLMCAPSRITEVQDLPANCLHSEVDAQGTLRLGLRFYAGKGFGSDIKWLPTAMGDIAQEAVRRLMELSEEGRRLAMWYEQYPDKFYRHEDCPDVSEDEPLSMEQACSALGLQWNGQSNLVHAYFKKYRPYAELRHRREPLRKL